MLKAAIVGFGGIAQAAHVPSWKILEESGLGKLVAACDIDEKQFTAKQEINIGSSGEIPELRTYTDLDEMLANEELDIIDVCTPTSVHSSLAALLLRRGYNVHSEKPMARNYNQCREMIAAANESGAKLMIGQCLRFSDPYIFLRDSVLNNTYGKPLSAVFRRMSGPPLWASNNWFMDWEQSGGCLLDMHIHDLDSIRFIFGEPKSVSCVTSSHYTTDDIAHSRLIYDDIAVTAIGDWSQEGTDFTADYRAAFEKATIILENGVVKVYPRHGEGEPRTIEMADENMYMKELRYFITDVIAGKENKINTPESAAKSIQLVETLKKSAEQNGAITPFKPE